MNRHRQTVPLLLPLGFSALLGGIVALAFLILSGRSDRGEPSQGFWPPRAEDHHEEEPGLPAKRFSFEVLRHDPEVMATNLNRYLQEDLLPAYLQAQSYEMDSLGMNIDSGRPVPGSPFEKRSAISQQESQAAPRTPPAGKEGG